MMNNQGSDPAHYNNSVVDTGGEATSCGGGGGGGGAAEGFLDMFVDRRSSGDLFDLVWKGRAGATSSIMEVQPISDLILQSPAAVALPPSEEEMAAWLYPIVRGDDLVVTGSDDEHHSGDFVAGHAADEQQAAPANEAEADHKREDFPNTDECRAEDSMGERRKIGGVRKSHHSETHNLTEKRRRCKINEKFKILQQLVPGCDKSNQVSTLDQTIQYMKSLQQQIQEMSFGCDVKPFAVYPVVPPPYLPPHMVAGLMPPATAASGVLLGRPVRPGVVHALPPTMIPFGSALLPLVHHHPAAAMASSPILYPSPAVRDNSISQNERGNCRRGSSD